MKLGISDPIDEDGRVVRLKPRDRAQKTRNGTTSFRNRDGAGPEPFPADDLIHYQQPRGDSDDFRRRMLANGAAFVFTILLTVAGLWLASAIADMRKTQDCILSGRRDCAPISTPHT